MSSKSFNLQFKPFRWMMNLFYRWHDSVFIKHCKDSLKKAKISPIEVDLDLRECVKSTDFKCGVELFNSGFAVRMADDLPENAAAFLDLDFILNFLFDGKAYKAHYSCTLISSHYPPHEWYWQFRQPSKSPLKYQLLMGNWIIVSLFLQLKKKLGNNFSASSVII